MTSSLKIFMLHPVNVSSLIMVANWNSIMNKKSVNNQKIHFFSGKMGVDGDGDIYNQENIREFKRFVLSQTEDKGVHFMMADGVIL